MITGKFAADFEAFYSAVQRAEAELKDFEKGSEAVEKQLNRMVDTFSGRKLIQDATLMAEAVERIGGASRLTEAELQKVAAKAAEAAEKMRAMGVDVPANMQALAGHLKTVDVALEEVKVETTDTELSYTKLITSFVSSQVILNAAAKAWDLVVDAIKEVGAIALQGAAVSDVTENFERLTTQAGLSAAALMGELRAATHGTIDDFTLMKEVTQSMAAGVNLTQSQLSTLAQGAFALAQTGAMSVTEAFAKMNDAMLTGQTRGIAMLTGKVNLAKAEEDLATSYGKSREELNEVGKLEASRIAILDAVSDATERLGTQTDGLDERVDQLKTNYANFRNELGKAIAESPVIAEAFIAIGDAISGKAFGATQQEAIKAIARFIDDAAIALVKFGSTAAEVGGFVARTVIAIDKVFGNLMQIVDGNVLAIQYLTRSVVGLLDAASLGQTRLGSTYAEVDARIQQQLETMAARGKRMQDDSALKDQISAGATKFAGILDDVARRMEATRVAAAASAGTQRELAAATDTSAAAATRHADAVATGAQRHREMTEIFKAGEAEKAASSDKASKVVLGNLNETIDRLARTQTTSGDATAQIVGDFERQGAAAAAAGDVWRASTKGAADFAVETVETATQKIVSSWSDAMAEVQAGRGTMTMDVQIAVPKDFDWTAAYEKAGLVATSVMPGGYPPGMDPRQARDTFTVKDVQVRASGGPVSASQPYLVGERGAELFVPTTAGSILPSGAGASSHTAITNVFHINGTGQEIARMVSAELTRQMRVGRKWPAS